MSKRRVSYLVLGLIVAVLAILLLFALRGPDTLRERALTGPAAQFMACLPKDLTTPQRAEIEGLLRRFQARAAAGKVRSEDHMEIDGLLRKYAERGSIDRSELNLVMAKIGYYSHRSDIPDTNAIHPLLRPIPTDSSQ